MYIYTHIYLNKTLKINKPKTLALTSCKLDKTSKAEGVKLWSEDS